MIDTAKLLVTLISVIGIVVVFGAIIMAAKAHRAQNSETMRAGVNYVGVMVVVAIGLSAATFGVWGTGLLRQIGFDI